METYKTSILGKEYEFEIEEAHSGTSIEEVKQAVELLESEMYTSVRMEKRVPQSSLIRFTDVNYVIRAEFYELDGDGFLDGGSYFESVIFDGNQTEETED